MWFSFTPTKDAIYEVNRLGSDYNRIVLGISQDFFGQAFPYACGSAPLGDQAGTIARLFPGMTYYSEAGYQGDPPATSGNLVLNLTEYPGIQVAVTLDSTARLSTTPGVVTVSAPRRAAGSSPTSPGSASCGSVKA